MIWKSKPRVAFFDFACCEGCQLTVLELNEDLLDMVELVELATWREVMSGSADDYDIAFCEGSISLHQDVERLERIRKTADIVVSLGACASIGCHNALKNRWPIEECLELVYGEAGQSFDTIEARPVTAVVQVDFQIQGCPVSLPEFSTVFKHILTGQTYAPPNQPVCVECKLNDNLCVYEKGLVCLGPVTRCGCNAICTSYGDACQGCRGLMDEANLEAAARTLTSEQLHGIMAAVAARHRLGQKEILAKFALYNNWPELELKDYATDD
jgi:coenzyme F420-reducing hydrogenase gamma subunit